MPKMKTKSGAKKRFKVTASGRVKFEPAHARHRLISKPKKMKRKTRAMTVMFKADGEKVLNYYLPYQAKKKSKGLKKAASRAAKLAAKTTAKPAAKTTKKEAV